MQVGSAGPRQFPLGFEQIGLALQDEASAAASFKDTLLSCSSVDRNVLDVLGMHTEEHDAGPHRLILNPEALHELLIEVAPLGPVRTIMRIEELDAFFCLLKLQSKSVSVIQGLVLT
ncbi:MAG: hypothetical protein ACK4OH_03465 [Acidovorax temperans]|uniref:hypothetical protein n=1 Tax=Acidovorax temperans TaxID=80878 RepID=UPI00391B37A8